MDEQLKQSALPYHQNPRPGKISVTPTTPHSNQLDLSLAYTRGVAAACTAIFEEPLDAQKYTSGGNLVGVVTNGTAVLGLGNIGPLAAKPVTGCKGCLFKKFAGRYRAPDHQYDGGGLGECKQLIRRELTHRYLCLPGNIVGRVSHSACTRRGHCLAAPL